MIILGGNDEICIVNSRTSVPRALSGSELFGPASGRWGRYAHVQLRGGPRHSRAVIQPVNCHVFTGCSGASVQSMLLTFEKCARSLKSVLDQSYQFITQLAYTHQQPAHHPREKIAWIDRFCCLIKTSVNDLVVAMFLSLRLDKEQQKFVRILRKLQLGVKSTKF